MTDFSDGRIARDAYDRFRQGDYIPDLELKVAAAYFRGTADTLIPLGEAFRFSANEAERVAQGLEGYVRSRGLDKTAAL